MTHFFQYDGGGGGGGGGGGQIHQPKNEGGNSELYVS